MHKNMGCNILKSDKDTTYFKKGIDFTVKVYYSNNTSISVTLQVNRFTNNFIGYRQNQFTD